MLICGIDESGRGPVIGPLVICGVLIDTEDEKKLKKIDVKDSKLLTSKQRERLYDKIIDVVNKHKIIILSPTVIDKALESSSSNLNWLEADNMALIINKLNPEKSYLDCPSVNIKKFTQYVKKKVDKKTEIIAEHKADVKYPVVSAASIIAKVTRDAEIEKIKKINKIDFGSGYPADPKTVEFLKNNFNKYPGIFRKSWMSFKTVVKQKNQKNLEEF